MGCYAGRTMYGWFAQKTRASRASQVSHRAVATADVVFGETRSRTGRRAPRNAGKWGAASGAAHCAESVGASSACRAHERLRRNSAARVQCIFDRMWCCCIHYGREHHYSTRGQHNEEMADMLEQQILAAFEARIETLGLRHKHRHAPDYVLIAALSVEYRNTCLAHHAAHSAAKQQQIDDALQKFTSQVHPCHNEGCVAQGQKNAFNATTGQFRSAICSRCKVVTYCSLSCQKEDWPKHKPFCREMTSAERRSNKCTIVQKYTKQTKAATAAVEQQLRTQIASMNCSDSAVLVSIRPSQLVRAHKMLLLEEVDVSGNTLDAAAQGAVCGHVGEFAGGAAGGDCLRKL